MIEFRYNPRAVSEKAMYELANNLEGAFRRALKIVRPSISQNKYGVTVEGDPFTHARNQPDLRVYVFYHADWNFTSEELKQLPEEFKTQIQPTLQHWRLGILQGKIRFYIRDGHASVSLP